MAKKGKSFVETRKRVDGNTEYYITKSPAKTLWGKIFVILIVAGMVVLPLIALIVEMFKSL